MINDGSRYLSHSRENFSNIVLSVPSGNGISILAGADKRRSGPALKIPPIPKKGESTENEEREKHEDEVVEGGAERARQTQAGRRRRARIKER